MPTRAWYSCLGPCPRCGAMSFDYGGGWRCSDPTCFFGPGNSLPNMGPKPDWWNTSIDVFVDGDQWCAIDKDNFTNVQESPAGFGSTPKEAVACLRRILNPCKEVRDE